MVLTHWGRDEIDAILQTTFSNVFSSMKMFKFRLKFHWSLFRRAQLTIIQYWFRYLLGADQATSHYRNQWWIFYWRKYTSLGLNELTHRGGVIHMCIKNHWFRLWFVACQALSGPMLTYFFILKPFNIFFYQNAKVFVHENQYYHRLQNGRHFVSVSMC